MPLHFGVFALSPKGHSLERIDISKIRGGLKRRAPITDSGTEYTIT